MEITMEDIVNRFEKSNGLTYQMAAICDDGTVLVKATSKISASDLVFSAHNIEAEIERMAIEDFDSQKEMDGEAEMQDIIDNTINV